MTCIADQHSAKNSFQKRPIAAYKSNTNLKERIGSNKILNSKVIRKKISRKKWQTLLSTSKKTNMFKSYRTGKTYKIFHQSICKRQGRTFNVEFALCNMLVKVKQKKSKKKGQNNFSLHTFSKPKSYISTSWEIDFE